MAFNAGDVVTRLAFRQDTREADAYERRIAKLKKVDDVETKAKFDGDTKGVEQYERRLHDAEKKSNDVISANGRLRTSFGAIYGRGGAAFAAAGGVAAIVAVGKASISTASDINESLTKNQVLFGEHAKAIDDFSKRSADAFGISRQAALEYTGVFGNLSRAIGISKEDSAGLSVRLTKLAADMASFNNTSIDDALEALRSGLVGETEPLRRFGVTLSANSVAAEAMRSGLVKVKKETFEYRVAALAVEKAQKAQNDAIKQHGKDSIQARTASLNLEKANRELVKTAKGGKVELTAQQKAIATTNLIMRQTSAAHGDFARTSSGAANQQRILTARLTDMRGELGAKLLPVVVKTIGGLNDFIDGMKEGRGAGGQFATAIGKIGGALGKLGRDFTSNERQVGGWISGFGRAESTVLKFTGKLVGGSAGRKLKEWGRNVDANADAVDRWRKQLTIDKEVDKIEDDLDRLRNKTSGTLHGILTLTHKNMAEIRRTMGTETARGQQAIHDNFQAAVTAIRAAMKRGDISTKTGLAQIRRQMQNELKELGISSALRGGLPLSPKVPKGDLPVTTNSAPVTKAGGGWLGARGMVGQDTINVLAAPGEAFLTRHQQPAVEYALRSVFGIGLDDLFSTITRPHYMARGGRVRMAFGGVTPAIAGLIEDLDSKGFHHGSTTGGKHAPNSFHYRGMAVDYGDASNDMQRLWSIVFPQRTRFAELFGPTRVSPGPHLMHNGAAFQNADLQADHQDHIHLALAGAIGALKNVAGGAAGAVWRAITAPGVGGTGMLHDVVQGTLAKAATAVNQRGRSLAAKFGAGPDLGGGPGGGSNSANAALGRTMAAAMGWTGGQWSALDQLWTGESGWSNTARNPDSGAFGIPQALPASKMGAAGAGGNPRAQIAWGLRYIKDRYGSPIAALRAWLGRSPHWYNRGGFVQRFARGGHVGPARAGGKAVGSALGTTLKIRSLRGLQTDRIADYENYMGAVEDDRNTYSRVDARYNLSEEELIDPDTGQLDQAAIRRRLDELFSLASIRTRIEANLKQARTVARRVVKTYRTIIDRLTKSLRHAKKKDRSGVRSQIKSYRERLEGDDGWLSKLKDLGADIYEAHTDVLDIRGEIADVRGTRAEPQDPATADTADTADTGADAGSGTTDTPDPAAAAPTAEDIARGVAEQFAAFNAARADQFAAFGSNFERTSRLVAGGLFPTGDQGRLGAGLRAFGAFGNETGAGVAVHLEQTFGAPPPDPHIWSQQAVRELGGALA